MAIGPLHSKFSYIILFSVKQTGLIGTLNQIDEFENIYVLCTIYWNEPKS